MESLTLVKWNTGEEIYLGGIQCKLLNSVKASGKKTVETNMQYIYIYCVSGKVQSIPGQIHIGNCSHHGLIDYVKLVMLPI